MNVYLGKRYGSTVFMEKKNILSSQNQHIDERLMYNINKNLFHGSVICVYKLYVLACMAYGRV